jgi:hypothetical protein
MRAGGSRPAAFSWNTSDLVPLVSHVVGDGLLVANKKPRPFLWNKSARHVGRDAGESFVFRQNTISPLLELRGQELSSQPRFAA